MRKAHGYLVEECKKISVASTFRRTKMLTKNELQGQTKKNNRDDVNILRSLTYLND